MLNKFNLKKVIMFDLDGTLCESKTNIDKEMASLLCKLLEKKIIAVVSGGKIAQFKNQFVNRLKCKKFYSKNLLILPTSGERIYLHSRGKWKIIHKHSLAKKEKAKIFLAFKRAYKDINYSLEKKVYGKILEDRGGQITFSALGQKAPLKEKQKWNFKNNKIRFKLKRALEKYLPDFDIKLGGLTSIDITKKGLNKAHGVREIIKLLRITKKEILYVGDALFKGGNDYVVKSTGVKTIEVKGPKDTKKFLQSLL